MTKRIKADGTSTKWLPLCDLIIEPTAQRPYDANRAKRYADNLDLALIRVLEVSERAGHYYIMDGNHRVGALRIRGFTDELVECRVHTGLEVPTEAGRFIGLNNATPIRAFDKFKVRVTGHDPVAVGIEKILVDHGWSLMMGPRDGSFGAVGAAEKVYTGHRSQDKERGPENFLHVIEVITAAWGHNAAGGNGNIVEGLGQVFAKYGSAVDRAHLIKVLAKFPGGADNFLGRARGNRETFGNSVAHSVTAVALGQYNKGRRSTRLGDAE